jgi:hypothetical protein
MQSMTYRIYKKGMGMKCIILLISIFFMTTALVAQGDMISPDSDTVSIWMNGKNMVTYPVKKAEDNIDLTIKKTAAAHIRQLMLQVKGPSVNGTIYKRSLEIHAGNMIDIAETKDAPGHFNIFNSSIIKKLTAGTEVPVYLMLAPANDMMMVSSKKIFVGNLMMK